LRGACFSNEEGQDNEDINTLLQVQKLEIANIQRKSIRRNVVGLWDPGSTLSFITFSLASELGLEGHPIELEICTVGGSVTKISSKKYYVSVFDSNGEDVRIEVLGIEQISTEIEFIDIDAMRKLFISEEGAKAERPGAGTVDLLIGFSCAAYHPVKVEGVGHLLLMKNRFGHIIAGTHPGIKETARKLVKHAVVLHVEAQMEEFHSIESLGVRCNPKCGGCRCGKCQTGGKDMTLVEEKEYELIKSGLVFNQITGRWLANYPWIIDPRNLSNNRQFALAILKSTEKRMNRNQLYAETYQKQIKDMLDRKVARKVTEQELREYKGPVFYIAHHDVLSPQSASTPMRVVFNSSARTRGGMSLNDCLAKGPCLLNQLLGILLRFRQERFAFIGDIKKMFHSIDIPTQDQMTHLFLWRDMEMANDPSTYAMTAVNMGDRPASAIAQTALRMTAEEAEDVYPEASKIVLSNSYMDDIPASTPSEESGMKVMRDIEKMVGEKGFKMKNWMFSGQKSKKDKSLDQAAVQALLKKDIENELSKVLGMEWETEEDVIQFRLSNIENGSETTKRSCLSTICRFFDPVGLLAPVTVSAKIILRKVWACRPKIDWDDKLTTELQREWNSFKENLLQVRSLRFNRSIRPMDAESPVLVLFSDASKDAYSAVAYVRWKTPSGFESTILTAKSRIAPLRIVDIVRLELCAAVLNARLYTFIAHELKDIRFERVYHIVDSEIVRAMINKDSYGFRTFAANRIGEIQDSTEKHNWYWVEGSLNIADVATRPLDTTAVDLGLNGEWQNGPEFLRQPVDEWPTKSETSISTLPEIKRTFVGAVSKVVSSSIASRIDFDRFSNLTRLLRATAWIEKMQQKYKTDKPTENSHRLVPSDILHAENTLVKYVQEEMHFDVKKGKYKKLVPTFEDGVIVVGGRAERWLCSTWNREKFILLPAKHQFSWLVAEKAHIESGHLAVESTIARIRSKYWIIGVRRMVRSIIGRCKLCKLRFKKLESQRMSPLPIERIKPSPAFQNTGLDYFGPFEVKGEVQKRVRGKCYGILFVCDSSRAVHADIVQNYTTEAFLQALRRFACIRGWPRNIHSDNGTQLVGAATDLKKAIQGLDWKELQLYGHASETTWTFCPADAPWQNGSTEALVKSIKRALNVVMGDKVCSYAEFQTVVYEAAQLVNQRPIGRNPLTPNDGTYLCPNDLLLGRSTNKVPQGPFAERSSSKQRICFIQEIVSSFWKRWSREVFPNLVIEPKWHTERRNVKINDVVMIQDSNVVRGEWKLGIVVDILKSKDGRVRNVEVRYKNGTTDVKVRRAVQRLIVIVPADSEEEEQEQDRLGYQEE